MKLVKRKIIGLLLASLWIGFGSPAIAQPKNPVVAGYIEWAWFDGNNVAFKAKLDTGAQNSSINAPDYRTFRKKGEKWVEFELINEKGQKLTIRRPLVRVAKVRRQVTGTKKRPVIHLNVCIGGVSSEVEFNLADRDNMNYQVLIGRSFLQSDILIDSGRQFIAPKACK